MISRTLVLAGACVSAQASAVGIAGSAGLAAAAGSANVVGVAGAGWVVAEAGGVVAGVGGVQSREGEPPAPDFQTEVDYVAWYEKIATAGMTPEQNAAELYAAIFGDPPQRLEFNGPLTQETPGSRLEPWDPATRVAWEAAYQRMKPKLAAFRTAAARPYAWSGVRFAPGEPRTLMTVLLPEMSHYRMLAKGAIENAWRAPGGRVDEKEFVATMRDVLNLARQIQRDPVMISQLVAIATRALVYESLLAAADAGLLVRNGEVIRLLKEDDSPVPPFRTAMHVELASAWSVLQHIQMKNGGRFGTDDLLAPGSLRFNAPRGRDALKACFDVYVLESEKPYDPETTARMDAAVEKARQADPLVGVLAPALSRAYELRLRTVATRRATRIVYEILHFYETNRKWPASLDEMPTETDRFARVDPYSGKPFVYRVVDGRPLLYSVAGNAKDDGGEVHDRRFGDDTPDADYIFWPFQP